LERRVKVRFELRLVLGFGQMVAEINDRAHPATELGI